MSSGDVSSRRPRLVYALRKAPSRRSEADVDEILALCSHLQYLTTNLSSEEERRAVAKSLRYSAVGDGRVVFSEGDRGSCMYLVWSGKLKVVAQYSKKKETGGGALKMTQQQLKAMSTKGHEEMLKVHLAFLKSGQHFGELALLNPMGTRAATVVAVQDCDLLKLDGEDFLRWRSKGTVSPALRQTNVWNSLSEELHTACFENNIAAAYRILGVETLAQATALRGRKAVMRAANRLSRAVQDMATLKVERQNRALPVQRTTDELTTLARKLTATERRLATGRQMLEITMGEELGQARSLVAQLKGILHRLQQKHSEKSAELAVEQAGLDEVNDEMKLAMASRDELQEEIDVRRSAVEKADGVVRVVNSRDRSGRTAAWLAAEAGHADMLVLLHKHDADLNLADIQGQTPLLRACYMGHVGIVQFALSLNMRILLEAEDNLGQTPLFIACKAGHVDVVRLLISCHLEQNLELPSKEGTTPLFVASEQGADAIVRLLVSEGHMSAPVLNRGHQADGRTALHAACCKDEQGIVRFLVEGGADIHCRDATGNTPFLDCCARGYLEMAKLLFEYSAREHVASGTHRADVSATGRSAVAVGFTNLVSHAGENSFAVGRGGLLEPLNIEQSNGDGETALWLACSRGNLELVRWLVLNGAKIEHDARNVSCFKVAAMEGHVAVVKYLCNMPVTAAVAIQRRYVLSECLEAPPKELEKSDPFYVEKEEMSPHASVLDAAKRRNAAVLLPSYILGEMLAYENHPAGFKSPLRKDKLHHDDNMRRRGHGSHVAHPWLRQLRREAARAEAQAEQSRLEQSQQQDAAQDEETRKPWYCTVCARENEPEDAECTVCTTARDHTLKAHRRGGARARRGALTAETFTKQYVAGDFGVEQTNRPVTADTGTRGEREYRRGTGHSSLDDSAFGVRSSAFGRNRRAYVEHSERIYEQYSLGEKYEKVLQHESWVEGRTSKEFNSIRMGLSGAKGAKVSKGAKMKAPTKYISRY